MSNLTLVRMNNFIAYPTLTLGEEPSPGAYKQTLRRPVKEIIEVEDEGKQARYSDRKGTTNDLIDVSAYPRRPGRYSPSARYSTK